MQKNRDLADEVMQADPKNPWAVLKVSKDANLSEVKKIYRKLVLRLHPDKNDAKNAHDAFIKAQKAMADITRILYFEEVIERQQNNPKYKNTPQKGFGIKKWMKL